MPHRALLRVWVWLQLWTSNHLPHSSGFSVPCFLCRPAAIFISSFLFVPHHTILWSSFCCACCRYRILDSVLHVCHRIDQDDNIHSNGTHVEIAKNISGAELTVSLGLHMHPFGAEHTYLNFPALNLWLPGSWSHFNRLLQTGEFRLFLALSFICWWGNPMGCEVQEIKFALVLYKSG